MLIGSDPENMRTKVIFCAAILSLTVSCAWAGERAAVDYINPLIGASTSAEYGEGKTFPGAATPFGLVQLSPDTITGGDNGPGYSYEHKTIEGFSFTHMSGIGWYGDLGNFQVMPAVGPLQTDRDRAKSEFRHDEETARAGYYGVKLRRYGILAEMTAAPRAGILRFTYPEARASRIQIDLHRRIGEKERWKQSSKQHIRVVDDHTIEGWMYCPCEDGGWGRGGGHVTYPLHFYAQFSKSLTSFGIWDKDQVMPGRSEYEGKNLGFYAACPTRRGEQVLEPRPIWNTTFPIGTSSGLAGKPAISGPRPSKAFASKEGPMPRRRPSSRLCTVARSTHAAPATSTAATSAPTIGPIKRRRSPTVRSSAVGTSFAANSPS
jgi:putative alpha-1,2-mannosidase